MKLERLFTGVSFSLLKVRARCNEVKREWDGERRKKLVEGMKIAERTPPRSKVGSEKACAP